MSRIEDYVEVVTQRLRPDAELHWDIANELRAHLEDAAAEARGRGLDEGESVEAALKAFGDADEVAQGLWQANRRRMRLHAVARWAGRALLLAAGALVVLLVGTDILVVRGVARAARGLRTVDPWDLLPLLPPVRPRSDLSEGEQFVWDNLTYELADAEALIGLYPDDPILYANYALVALCRYDDLTKPLGEERLREVLDILDRGEGVEPGNALYDHMKATVLLLNSAQAIKGEGIPFQKFRWHVNETEPAAGQRVLIEDAQMFERAMREIAEGAAKPYWSGHETDWAELRRRLSAPPRTLPEHLALVAEEHCTLIWASIPVRHALRMLPGCAVAMAEEGDREAAAELAGVMQRPALPMGVGAGITIQLLVAQSVLMETAGQAPGVFEKLGMPGWAAEAHARYDQLMAQQRSAMGAPLWAETRKQVLRDAGLLGGMLLPADFAGDPRLTRPLRTVEHVFAERAVLGLLTAALGVMILAVGCAAAWQAWRGPGSAEGPGLLFIGWRRLGMVILGGVVVPLGLYWAWTRLSPFSALRYGLGYAPGWRLAELGTVYALVALAVPGLGWLAVRARGREVGLEVSPLVWTSPLRYVRPVVTSALIAGILGSLAAGMSSYAYGGRWAWSGAGVLLAVAVFPAVLVADALLHRGRDRTRTARLHRVLVRNLLPVLAACLLVVGVTSHAYLRHSEAKQVALLNQPGHRLFLDAIEMSRYKGLGDHLRELNRQWNEEHGLPTDVPREDPVEATLRRISGR